MDRASAEWYPVKYCIGDATILHEWIAADAHINAVVETIDILYDAFENARYRFDISVNGYNVNEADNTLSVDDILQMTRRTPPRIRRSQRHGIRRPPTDVPPHDGVIIILFTPKPNTTS